MTGHDEILAMRRAGRKPIYVWVTDHAKVIPSDYTVRIQPSDVPEQLDFRFLVGLTALVEGADASRVERIATACSAVAKRVVATTTQGRTLIRMTDTEGILQWRN